MKRKSKNARKKRCVTVVAAGHRAVVRKEDLKKRATNPDAIRFPNVLNPGLRVRIFLFLLYPPFLYKVF
jgi:hypothetical protein